MAHNEHVLLIQRCRPVPLLGHQVPSHGQRGTVDVRIVNGAIVKIAPTLRPLAHEEVIDAEGRWALPGLWDAHVHLTQWALATHRLDLAGATSAANAVQILVEHLAAERLSPTGGDLATPVQGFGHRSATWSDAPTVAMLDAVCPDRPVVLISGDAHHAWLNTRALDLLGLPRRDCVVVEREWFEAFPHLNALEGVQSQRRIAVRDAVQRAAAKGIVGIGEMEFAANDLDWPQWISTGIDALRVRTAVYPDRLPVAIQAGYRTGDFLDDSRLATMGPLKIIFDGSLNTQTAWCHHEYGNPPTYGMRNHSPEELSELVRTAHHAGIAVAVHTLGDAAVAAALDVFEKTGARGSLEHVQLLDPHDAHRMAALGVTASVQPAHVLDDAEVTDRSWPDHAHRCFALRELADAGARIALGSDAPVAPLDPWLAMATAVWRGETNGEPWHQEQALTPHEALAASVDGRHIAPGQPGDMVLLNEDPLARDVPSRSAEVSAHRLRHMSVAVTICRGRVTHAAL